MRKTKNVITYNSLNKRLELIYKCNSCSSEQLQLESTNSFGNIMKGCFYNPKGWSSEETQEIYLFYCPKCTLVRNIIK